MTRTKILLIFVTFVIIMGSSSLIAPPFLELNTNDNHQISPIDDSIHSADPEDIGPLIQNINPNPGMEYTYSNGVPEDYDYYSSHYCVGDDTYQNLTNTGNYAGYMSSMGAVSSGYSYLGYYLGGATEKAYLIDDLSLDCYVYLLENPDLSRGAYNYLYLSTNDGSISYQIHYIISYGSGSYYYTNNSNSVYYYINQTSYSWVNIVRNVTADYIDYFGFPSPNRYIEHLYFYTNSPASSSEKTTMVIDDVSLTNTTAYEFILNGDFESGTGSYWEYWRSSPGYIQQTTDCTRGSYAANLSITSNGGNSYGFISFYSYYYYPVGLYPTEPGKLLINFDWKYTEGSPSDNNQFARIYLRFRNDTSSGYIIYYYLGTYLDYIGYSNTTMEKYIHSPDFGSRATWNHDVLDVSVLAEMAGFTKDVCLYDIRFELSLGYTDTSSIEFLIDEFNIITYPAVDPGFEEAWKDDTNYLTSWSQYQGELGVFSRTTDAHSGNYALNLTTQNNDDAGVERYNIELDVKPDILTDFWWLLDEFTGTYGYARILLYFNDYAYSIEYLMARAGYAPTNSSSEGHYYIDEINQTDIWYNLQRNMTYDLEAVFGKHDWKLNDIVLSIHAGVSTKVSILMDDINFIDGQPPEIIDVHRSTANPVYYEPVEISVETVDALVGVWGVQIYYNGGSGWSSVFADPVIGNIYEAIIPIFSFATLVQYYVNVTDFCGTSAIDDNGGIYYSYSVDDDVNPSISLNRPYDDSVVSGMVHLEATAADVGSGIDHVVFYVDLQLVFSDSVAPFEYDWDSRTMTNGTYDIRAEAYDATGMHTIDEVTVHIQNDVAGPLLSFAQINPSAPEVNESVRISIAVSDATLVENVTLFHRIGDGSWISHLMTDSIGFYFYDIPQTDEVTHVSFYIVAFDSFGQSTSLGTALAPLGYDVVDTLGITLPPMISSAMLSPINPEYSDTVTISVIVTDASSITNVTIYYRLNSGSWTSVLMEHTSSLYYYDITPKLYGSEIDYYIEATNDRALTSTLGNSSNPLSYFVDDFTNPIISISGPISGSNVTGVQAFIISGTDIGSGIEHITVHINGALETDEDQGTIYFDWDTLLVLNGEYVIVITVTDQAGNSAMVELTYTVQNPLGLDAISAALGSFMASYGFFVGLGTIAILYFGVPFLMKRRAVAKAA